MTTMDRTRRSLPLAALALAALVALPVAAATAPPPAGSGTPCEEFSDGSWLPLPPGCQYYGPEFKDLLPPDEVKRLLAKPIHRFFVCIVSGGGNENDCRKPGGNLGGEVEEFTSEVVLEVHGEGELAGFDRTVTIPNVAVEVHTSPQVPGATTQDLATEMVRIQGCLPPGDPDFGHLCIVGGSANGLPSHGRTTGVYDEARGVWVIDSSFEVGYIIEFAGAPGGRLDGYAGDNVGVSHMSAQGNPINADADTAN